MSDNSLPPDGDEFTIDYDTETKILHLLFRGEVFISASIPVLALCVQEIVKRVNVGQEKSERSQ